VNRLQRFVWKLRYLRTTARGLNRRVDVENVLFNVAAGKRPMLTRDECRALAVKLGTLG
jgi:hypothetical protein